MTKLVKEITQRGLVIVPVIISVKTLIGTQGLWWCKVQLHQSCAVTRTPHGSCFGPLPHPHNLFVGKMKVFCSNAQNNGEKSCRCGLGPSPCAVSILLHLAFLFPPDFFISCSLKLKALPAFSHSVLAMLSLLEHEIKEWQNLSQISSAWQGPGLCHSLARLPSCHLLRPTACPQSKVGTDICDSVFVAVTHSTNTFLCSLRGNPGSLSSLSERGCESRDRQGETFQLETFIWALAVMWQRCLGAWSAPAFVRWWGGCPACSPPCWIPALLAQGNHISNQTPVVHEDHSCGKALRMTGKNSSLQEMHYRSSHMEGSWLHLSAATAKADSVNLFRYILSSPKRKVLYYELQTTE